MRRTNMHILHNPLDLLQLHCFHPWQNTLLPSSWPHCLSTCLTMLWALLHPLPNCSLSPWYKILLHNITQIKPTQRQLHQTKLRYNLKTPLQHLQFIAEAASKSLTLSSSSSSFLLVLHNLFRIKPTKHHLGCNTCTCICHKFHIPMNLGYWF